MTQRICSVEGCDLPHDARGWCRVHYGRWRRHGDPLYHPSEKAPCRVDDCDAAPFGHGYCQRHYQRWKKHGDPLFEFGYPVQKCKVEGCGETFTRCAGHGMCTLHYQRWKKHGDPHYVIPRRVGVEPCSIEGCDKLIKAWGYCSRHASLYYKRGSAAPRMRGEIRDGKRICGACGEDVPIERWHIVGGVYRACLECAADYNRMRGHIRRVKIRGDARTERFSSREIFERDGWLCGICRDAIDRALTWPQPESASLDHVIPIARGGGHTRENSQASHLRCNLRKHASLPDEAAS